MSLDIDKFKSRNGASVSQVLDLFNCSFMGYWIYCINICSNYSLLIFIKSQETKSEKLTSEQKNIRRF